MSKSREELLQELNELKEQKRLVVELPHRHKFKEYAWAREFKLSTNRMKILTAGNQLGKSTTLIQHTIDLAGDNKLQEKFFKKRKPKTFWYIYPTKDKVEEEIATKWDEFLPKGYEKDNGPFRYKWTKVGTNKALKFLETDVLVIFKTWRSDLQSGTVDAVFCDEEIPADIYPEISMRIARFDGLFAMVFTATLNQAFWYDAIERIGKEGERFPEADKWQISAEHDCEFYYDGTPSPWTPEKIKSIKAKCGSQTEIDRRVHGRFVSEQGLKYESFNQEKNVIKETKVTDFREWLTYSGIDYGSGGATGHPGSIAVVSVMSDFSYGVTRYLWRGNSNEVTTASDILDIYRRDTARFNFIGEYYDWAAKDLKTIAERHGYNLMPAEKSKDYDFLNVLFKNQMLDIDESIDFAAQLIEELKTLRVATAKTKAKDDLIDSLKYATSSVPWQIDSILKKERLKKNIEQRIHPRMENGLTDESYGWDVDDLIDEINELAGGY